jgi:predicted RNA-binding Zn-ribbon protein involved in translation (DUF1610 family)
MMGDSLLEDFCNYRHAEALTAILVAVSMIAIIPIILLRDFVWFTLPAAGGFSAYALLSLIHELRESPVILKCDKCDFTTFSRKRLAIHSLDKHGQHFPVVPSTKLYLEDTEQKCADCGNLTAWQIYRATGIYRCSSCRQKKELEGSEISEKA